MKHNNTCKPLISILTLFSVVLVFTGALGIPAAGAKDIADRNLVQNGDFSGGGSHWSQTGTGTGIVETGGPNDGPAGGIEGIMEEQAGLYQQLYLPSEIDSARFSFKYKVIPILGYYSYPPASQLYVEIADQTSTLAPLFESSFIYEDTGWQEADVALDAAAIRAVMDASASGRAVYLNIVLVQQTANAFKATIADVVFSVDGSVESPEIGGDIAFIQLNANGYGTAIRMLDPSDENGTSETVWAFRDSTSFNSISDVEFRPDGAELAFVSDHEAIYSPFHSDIFGVRPDGSGLRKISNPPLRSDITAGNYRTGGVTGSIRNEYGSAPIFLLYIEGAAGSETLSMGGYGSETSFTVSNVADLGPGVLQYVVFSWGGTDRCANGKEYAAAIVDVLPGQTVDIGAIDFHGYCNEYKLSGISWKGDGSEICFTVGGQAKKLPAAGGSIGTDLFTTGNSAYGTNWSPVDDRILYYGLFPGGIFLTNVGGNEGTNLIPEGYDLFESPVWLPDGSGFVFVMGNDLYQYKTATGAQTKLTNYTGVYAKNPSLSPDGAYVVFEVADLAASPTRHDLWIMNRENPLDTWRITSDGKSSNPSWGEIAAPVELAAPELTVLSDDSIVRVSWTEVTGAAGYILYYAFYPNAEQIFPVDLGPLTELAFDGAGAALFLAVQAYSGAEQGDISNIEFFDLR